MVLQTFLNNFGFSLYIILFIYCGVATSEVDWSLREVNSNLILDYYLESIVELKYYSI